MIHIIIMSILAKVLQLIIFARLRIFKCSPHCITIYINRFSIASNKRARHLIFRMTERTKERKKVAHHLLFNE